MLRTARCSPRVFCWRSCRRCAGLVIDWHLPLVVTALLGLALAGMGCSLIGAGAIGCRLAVALLVCAHCWPWYSRRWSTIEAGVLPLALSLLAIWLIDRCRAGAAACDDAALAAHPLAGARQWCWWSPHGLRWCGSCRRA